MSYIPASDFLALMRQTSGGVRTARMPGLDFVVAALSRAGMFSIWTGTTAPAVNQATTVWFKPASQPWAGEGVVYLWNATTAEYEIATTDLWAALLTAPISYVFQSVTIGAAAINAATTLLAIQRAGPVATALGLPSVALRGGRPLQIVDWSTAVVGHTISLTPSGVEKIMTRAGFAMVSAADQLAGVTLYPSTNLNGWVIAP